MRSVQLQSALSDYLEAAAVFLAGELAAGAEIPFELDRQPGRGGRGPSLYCYRPLTAEFIADRRPALEALAEHAEASRLLTAFEGLERYLVAVGEDVTRLTPAARVRAALGSLLGEVFAEQSDFELHEERVRAALERLQSTALTAGAEVTIVARLRGSYDHLARAAAGGGADDRPPRGAGRAAARRSRRGRGRRRAPDRRARHRGAGPG